MNIEIKKYAEREFEEIRKLSSITKGRFIVEDYEKEIIDFCNAISKKSKKTSIPLYFSSNVVGGVITSILKKMPIVPLTGEESEWERVEEIPGVYGEEGFYFSYFNKRCQDVSLDKYGFPIYCNAITFEEDFINEEFNKGGEPVFFTSNVQTYYSPELSLESFYDFKNNYPKEVKKITSTMRIKSFPFEPKQFKLKIKEFSDKNTGENINLTTDKKTVKEIFDIYEEYEDLRVFMNKQKDKEIIENLFDSVIL
jgi:hypothetical protein